MTLLIEERDPFQAWQEGTKALVSVSSKEIYNLITTISDPTHLNTDWFSDYNPACYKKERTSSLSDVATTIFPYKFLPRQYTRKELYKRYIECHERGKRIHRKTAWGTYFDRMIRFGKCECKTNQLENIIHALSNWSKNPKASLVIHTSSADTDKPKPRGLPCLQYIALLCPDKDTASMLAVYRNHDFFSKAFGNFIGLGQLLKFICNETKREPGTLVCHSAHAYYENKAVLKKYAGL